MKLFRIVSFFAIVCAPLQAAAACDKGWSSNALGWCFPNASGDIADAGNHLGREAWAQTHGPTIATWLQTSRDTAVASSNPIPPNVRQKLRGFVSEDVLNNTHYKVGDNGVINAAANILGATDIEAAVTLVDVIVFRDNNDAQNNMTLWAHELKHVQQFREWGTLKFGIMYARNPDDVEIPARNEEARYLAWAPPQPIVVGTGGTGRTGRGPRGGTTTQFAKVCVTPFMVCQMTAIGPIGMSCYCPTIYGPSWGQSM